jgi:uncharacterized membrane protein YedE/YeeE
MDILILIFGFLFGGILQYANLNKYNTISGLALLEDFAVIKTIAFAIGLGAILLSIEIGLGMASFHIKPFALVGILLGGIIFGAGMTILGYCPGTLAISVGQGSVDAFIGVIGGLFGGYIFSLFLPNFQNLLGPNLGEISLNTLVPNRFLYYFLVLVLGLIFIYISFWLHKFEKKKDYKWLHAGIGLAILSAIIFSHFTTGRPIGASTSFPYAADFLTGFVENDYFNKIEGAGSWELKFLAGAFLAGLIISLIKKEFKFKLIYKNWEKYKGTSSIKRIIWAFIGGFILIFGARMAEGCTSGHILSGGMQIAISSLVFAIFTFIGLLLAAKIFFNKKNL